MDFSEGQIVVHPHHGPARVAAVTTRTVRSEPRQYLKLEVLDSSLVVGLPLAGAEEAGVRHLLGPEAVEDVFAVLVAPTGHEEAGGSRRIKDNVERLRSGDILTVAGLVRDLTRRQADKGISLGEKDVLRDALRPLVAELSIVLGRDEAGTTTAIDAAVLEGVVPPVPRLAAAG